MTETRNDTSKIKCRLFVDMDGTINYFNNNIDSLDSIFSKGYFSNLRPRNQIIEAIKEYSKHDSEIYVIANVIDSPYVINEKNEWLDKYLPELDQQHRIFVPYGKNKTDYIQGNITKMDFLIDDSEANLIEWNKQGSTIKLVNELNDRESTWSGESIYYNAPSRAIAFSIRSIQNRCVLNELFKNKDFFLDLENDIYAKENSQPVKKQNIADRIKDAKEKASNQRNNMKVISKNGPQR